LGWIVECAADDINHGTADGNEGDDRCDGIAGQGKYWAVIDIPDTNGLSRLDGERPEFHCATPTYDRANVIPTANGHAPWRDQEIAVMRGTRQRALQQPRLVAENAEVDDLTAHMLKQASQDAPVCVPDLTVR
jgi:hypothetical protein